MSINSQFNENEKINKNQTEKAIPHYLKSNVKIKILLTN